VFQGLAKAGDFIGGVQGRRFMFNSDTLEKLAGYAWCSSQKIEQELGFQAHHHLCEVLQDIVQKL